MKGTIPTVLLALLSGSPASAGPVQRRQEAVPQTVTAGAPAAAPTPWSWNAGGSRAWPIHASCNATERALLHKGLDDAAALAAHARDHVLRFGNTSELFQKYFGAAPSAEVIGWYAKIADGDRSRFKFRCDDPDGNCVLPGALPDAISSLLLTRIGRYGSDRLLTSFQAGEATGAARTAPTRPSSAPCPTPPAGRSRACAGTATPWPGARSAPTSGPT